MADTAQAKVNGAPADPAAALARPAQDGRTEGVSVPITLVANLMAFGMQTDPGKALVAGWLMGKDLNAPHGLVLNGADVVAVPQAPQG